MYVINTDRRREKHTFLYFLASSSPKIEAQTQNCTTTVQQKLIEPNDKWSIHRFCVISWP